MQHRALHGGRRGGRLVASQREDGEARAERERDGGEKRMKASAPPTTRSARYFTAGGCGTGAWAGSMRPNLASKPLSGRATYGNVVRNGFSF